MKPRDPAVDTAKGILIILVVLGHSGYTPLARYIFWFHMPAFFLISGYLFDPANSAGSLVSYVRRKVRSYGLLYASYFVLFTLLSFAWIDRGEFSLFKTLLKFAVGGRYVGRELGVFWFISCLCFSLCAFAALKALVRSPWARLLVLTSCYLLAHVESRLLAEGYAIHVPLNLDVALLAVAYIAMGHHFRGRVRSLLSARFALPVVSLILLGILAAEGCGLFRYSLNMKYVVYPGVPLDLAIPCVFTLFVLQCSHRIAKARGFGFLRWFGYYSVSIMFWHLAVHEMYLRFFPYHWAVFTVIGSVLPLLIAVLFDKSRVARLLFLRGAAG